MLKWRRGSRDLKRALEDVAVSWTVQALEHEGRTVTILGRPDRDPLLRPDLVGRPDLAVTIDGGPAAVEVTEFWTQQMADAAARAAEIRRATRSVLVKEGPPGRTILGLVSYEPSLLAKLDSSNRAGDAKRIADALLAIAASRVDLTSFPLAKADLPAWVRGASLTTNAGARPSVDCHLVTPRTDLDRHVDVFLGERIGKKGNQHAGWGAGILVVVHNFGFTADLLRKGLLRRNDVPWWRVYWMHPEPLPELVWQSASRHQ